MEGRSSSLFSHNSIILWPLILCHIPYLTRQSSAPELMYEQSWATEMSEPSSERKEQGSQGNIFKSTGSSPSQVTNHWCKSPSRFANLFFTFCEVESKVIKSTPLLYTTLFPHSNFLFFYVFTLHNTMFMVRRNSMDYSKDYIKKQNTIAKK